MMRPHARLCGLLFAICALAGAVRTAAAEPAPSPPRERSRHAEGAPDPGKAAPNGGAPAAGRAQPGWLGPRVGLSYRVYSLRDDQGGRAVHTGGFAGFLPTRFVRAGGGVEAGVRTHEFGARQGLLSGNVFIGYQHLRDLGRFVPYLCARGELGIVLQKPFHTPLSTGFRGAGVELGTDVNLVRSLHMGLAVSFMLYTMDGLAYDTFGLRLSIGL
jgi:hypothetical protein